MTPTVFLAGSISADALALLRDGAEVRHGYGPGAVTLESVAGEIDAILARTDEVPAEIIAAAPRLRVISRRGVGVDNIAIEAATARGIPVLITATANARTVAEHAFGLALAVSHRILIGDAIVREGRFADRDAILGSDLSGARLGVLGLGRIGREVCRIGSRGFGMRVTGYDPFAPEGTNGEVAVAGSLAELLRSSDVVSVHVPLSPDTEGLIGAAELALMPRGSMLIQTARGGIVDEHALAESVRSGHLAGAGVDVFEAEPPAADHPFVGIPQIVLTPHTSGLTEQAVQRMSRASVEGILDVLGGTPVDVLLQREDWKVVNPGFVDALPSAAVAGA